MLWPAAIAPWALLPHRSIGQQPARQRKRVNEKGDSLAAAAPFQSPADQID
jgi:hypothetical protein